MRLIVLLFAFLVVVPLAAFAAVQEDNTVPYKPDVEPGTSRAWALLTSAVLFERNKFTHDQLGGVTRDAKTKAAAVKLLEDDWDIAKREELLQELEHLKRYGHRDEWGKRMQELAKLSAQELENRLKRIEDEGSRDTTRAMWNAVPRVAKLKSGLLAWDLCRYVAICRWGFAAGLLTEVEAWELIEPVTKQLQKAYASWDELGTAFCIGREIFRPGKNAETEAAFERLRTGEKSPWRTTGWNLKLGKLDKPEKAPPAPRK